MDSPQVHHVGSDPSSCEGIPLKAAPTVVCARASLAVPAGRSPASNDARRVRARVRERSGRTPLRVGRARWLALRLRGHTARFTHRSIGAFVGLRGTAGDACTLCRYLAYGGNSGEREDATIAVVSTEMRDCEIAATHGHRVAHATLRLHLAYRSRCPSTRPIRCSRRLSRPRPRQRNVTARFLEEPGARVSVDTGPPSRDVFRPAGSRTADYDSTVSTTANFSPTFLGTAMITLSILRCPRSVQYALRFLTRYALAARTKLCGLATSRSLVPRPVFGLVDRTWQQTCTRSRWTAAIPG